MQGPQVLQELGLAVNACNPDTRKGEPGGSAIQGHPGLLIELEASLSYMRSTPQKKGKKGEGMEGGCMPGTGGAWKMVLVKVKVPLGHCGPVCHWPLTLSTSYSPSQSQIQPPGTFTAPRLPPDKEGGLSPSKRMLKAEAAWPWSDVNSMRMLLPSLSRPSKGTLSVLSESYRRADVFVRPL